MAIKLLFADDSVTIQKVVELAFESEDVAVTTVGSGEKVMEKLKESRPDVIIADIVMSDMNGLELCEKIKKDKDYSNIPVLLLHSEFDDFDRDTARRAGADDCITKPFKSEELIKKVKEIAAKKTGQFNEVADEEKMDKILNPKNNGKISGEVIEHTESAPSIKATPIHTRAEEEVLNISGLLNNEEIENIKNEIKKAEEELLRHIEEIENETHIPLKTAEKDTAEKIMKDTAERLILSLSPQIVKAVENTIYKIISSQTESPDRKEDKNIKNAEIE